MKKPYGTLNHKGNYTSLYEAFSLEKRVNLLFIIIFYEVISMKSWKHYHMNSKGWNPFCQGPQRIGNLEYGTTETYFPHCKWGSRCGMGEWQKVSSHQRRWPTVLKLSWGGYIFMGPIHELKCIFNTIYVDILRGKSLPVLTQMFQCVKEVSANTHRELTKKITRRGGFLEENWWSHSKAIFHQMETTSSVYLFPLENRRSKKIF